MALVSLLAGIALLGVLITTVQIFLTLRLVRRRRRPFAGGSRESGPTDSRRAASTQTPLVTILKPLCGLEDGLRENLESFASLRGIRHEVIFSVADPRDPAATVARAVMETHPAAPFHLVSGGTSRTLNPKIERLIAAMEHARGEIILVSDANVRTGPDAVANTITAFDDPRVGCVSNLFTGAHAHDWGSALEALHLLTFVLPGCTTAAAAGVPCVVGKSMAVRASVLSAIGGFERFGNVLAEDQAIGLAVREAGYAVRVSPHIVQNVIMRRTVGRAMARQVRWNKIRFAFSRPTYVSEFLVNPFPLALIAAALARLEDTSLGWTALAAAVATGLLRILQAAALDAITGSGVRWHHLLLAPVQDVLQWLAQFAPFLSDRVSWRGHRARIGRGTVMYPPPTEQFGAM